MSHIKFDFQNIFNRGLILFIFFYQEIIIVMSSCWMFMQRWFIWLTVIGYPGTNDKCCHTITFATIIILTIVTSLNSTFYRIVIALRIQLAGLTFLKNHHKLCWINVAYLYSFCVVFVDDCLSFSSWLW